jgi:hypothetical protein
MTVEFPDMNRGVGHDQRKLWAIREAFVAMLLIPRFANLQIFFPAFSRECDRQCWRVDSPWASS